jgi:hypothetical protein
MRLARRGMNKGGVVSAGEVPECPSNLTLSNSKTNPKRIEWPTSVTRFVDEVDNNG